ncbi:arginyl-tRNA synthetase [Propionibacterium cyclohexanicum]|uniref:Arginine--tRNA ligase n=1 Tax=Propionibacterium cyclohexanicum TaxID=64702 RepID=A0A1H9T471_9ACTN|nr:arginine--tRNA ligase [Propionibacterium cyclohexanicum]SER91916.1 arginyl-tRNA synthetase [Propionibacterium cyclohexanicum]
MSSLPSQLSARIQAVTGADPELRPATKPQFGHFQSNVALRLSKAQGRPPREVAASIVEALDVADLCETPEIAGPGFINFRLRSDVLAAAVTAQLHDPHAGIAQATSPSTIVIDYSAPNAAKQMHVGHLRSTIIGDCFNRVLSAQGHRVIAQNHIGDWGRQFGMLIEQALDEGFSLDGAGFDELDLAGAEQLYKRANAHLKADQQFADRARERVVLLQAGDPQTRAMWQRLVELSKRGFDATYARMGVRLGPGDYAGESTYNEALPAVCEDLESRGIAVVDQGALVVFVDGFDAPAILRNSQGGYGYDVTDIAAVRHRVADLGAGRLIYVVGSEQTYHFNLVFGVCRKAGYLPSGVRAQHVGYGMVLGADGKKLSTREGTASLLNDLLDQAEEHATPAIALAAIKYADLSNSLQKDYVFDPERMTQTTGDTGPYLQYAHARVSQILRRAREEAEAAGGVPARSAAPEVSVLAQAPEQQLALWLTRFGEAVDEVAEELTPHKLCTYLFELATIYSSFYENCPVLRSQGQVRASRLGLCAATRQVLAKGLELLGIEAPERM